jgi:hypothetical protein
VLHRDQVRPAAPTPNTPCDESADRQRGVVKHYLQDIGSTVGVGANGPHDWNERLEHVWKLVAFERLPDIR